LVKMNKKTLISLNFECNTVYNNHRLQPAYFKLNQNSSIEKNPYFSIEIKCDLLDEGFCGNKKDLLITPQNPPKKCAPYHIARKIAMNFDPYDEDENRLSIGDIFSLMKIIPKK